MNRPVPSGGGTFSRRTVLVLVGLCVLSLLVGLLLAVFQEELAVVRSTGPDTYSYSALGHRGLKTLLEELGHGVLVSRSASAGKAGDHGVLVVAEPDLAAVKGQRLNDFLEMCDLSEGVLVVLPKRRGNSDPGQPRFLETVGAVPPRNLAMILEALGIEAAVTRAGHTRDLHWDRGAWSDRPFIDQVQLIEADNLAPLIACERGTLLGHLLVTADTPDAVLFPSDILVLTDPDLLANHGLGLGRNAEIAVKIIDYLRDEGGVVVFDETLHGFGVSPSLLRAFFRIPLVFVLLQVLLAAGAFLWLANGRFGSPRPAAPAGARGLDFLIDNTAELLEYGGHGPFVLGRYFQAAQGAVCRRLHLDSPAAGSPARRRLTNISRTRSPEFDFEKMAGQVPAVALDGAAKPAEVLALARAIHRWQQEMTHGL